MAETEENQHAIFCSYLHMESISLLSLFFNKYLKCLIMFSILFLFPDYLFYAPYGLTMV